jgi:diguanylate cyclase (GGDEF)-like protein
VRWIFAHVEAAEWRGDRVVRLAGYDQDITDRRRVEERRRNTQRELAHQQRVLERIARGEPLANTLVSLCRHVERRYPGARCSILLLDRTAGALRALAGPALPPSFHSAIDGLPVGDGVGACGTAAARREVVVIEDTVAHPYTQPFIELIEAHNLYSVWSHPLTKVSGEVLGTFAVYRDKLHRPSKPEIKFVTTTASLAGLAIERSQSEAELMKAANLDSLTALPNRARFLEVVNRELTEQPDRRLTVMFLDLDRFKVINDTLGHPAGDRILIGIAERLREVVDQHDACALVARFGGDEFTMMVRDVGEDEVFALADQLRDTIQEPFELDGGEFFLSVSTGIAVNDHPADAYALVREADAAMYAAKGHGSGRREVYDARLRQTMMERLERETELRHAIERNELVVHYQPILRFSPRRWEGVEALVRWQHPRRGLVPPDKFIPLAEETGLIVPLGSRVLELVAEQAAAWAQTLPGIHVAANVSAVQLADPSLATYLIDLLEAHGLTPSAVWIEVTESAVMEEIESASEVLERLSAAGVGVLIDDFGTGYSSIARLGELPITGLKIDRRFTARLGVDPPARHVLEAISYLARAHDLQLVAEGIEEAWALGEVDELGCHFAQGYHLGRPAPAEVVERLLSQPPP